MAGKLIFSLSAVRGLIAHAVASDERTPTFSQLYEPEFRLDGKHPADDHFANSSEIDPRSIPRGLLLVKDQGVYLMSNGKREEGEKPEVVYAEGLNPAVAEFDDWWDSASDICGGDDFVEALPLSSLPTDGQQFSKLVVTVAGDSLTLEMAA